MTRVPRLVLYAALGVALVLGGVVLAIDRIASSAVEAGAETATGVDANVGGAHVGLVLATFSLRDFTLANPEGFEGDAFLRLEGMKVSLPTRNLLADEIRVPELVIEGLELELERGRGRSNYGQILKNLERGAAAPDESEGGRTIVIERVVVRDARARLRASPLPPIEVDVPEVVLRNVGGTGSTSENAATVVRTILVGVLGAVANDTAGIPREVARELAGGLRGVAQQEAAARTGELGRAAGEAVRRLSEGIGRLFGGDDEKP